MAADAAGELYVKLRPDSSGFTSEAEGPIAAAGKDLSKVFLAAFAVGGIAETIKGVVTAATEHQSAFAVLGTTIANAGASNKLYGESIEELLEKEARLKGFSDEDLASAFQRLVSVTHDSGKAFTDLGEAEDLARFRHIDLATAALALAKAEQGSATSLQRYGIIVPKVTTDVDALRAKYTQLQEAGVKLDAAQKAAYQSALLVAAAHDKQATSAAALAEVESRVGGAAQTFADTASGQFARLQQDFHQFEVAIGAQLLGALAGASDSLGTFFTKLAANKEVERDFATFVGDVSTGFHDIAGVVRTVGPPLQKVSDALGGVDHALAIAAGVLIGGRFAGAFADIGSAAATSAGEITLWYGAEATAGATAVTAGGEIGAGTAAIAASGAAAVTATGYIDAFEASIVRLGALAAVAIPVVIAVEIEKHDGGLSGEIGDFVHNVGTLLHENVPKGDDLLKTLIGDPGEAGVLGNQIWKLVGAPAEDAGKTAGSNFFAGFLGAVDNAGLKGDLAAIFDPINSAVTAAGDAAKLTAKTKASEAGASAAKAAADALKQGIESDKQNAAELAQEMANAVVSGAEAINQAVQSAKANFISIGASLAGSIGTFLVKPLNDESAQLGLAGDKIALQFDTIDAKLNARATVLDLASQRLSLASQARQAQFAAENALLTQQQNRIGLRSDQQTLANLRTQIALPGGKELSTNTAQALAQLEALEKKTKDPALADFITRFQSAGIAVTRDKIGIATTPNPGEAKRAADLGVASAKNALDQAGVNARKQVIDTAAQLKRDHLQILQDAAAIETTTATTMLANLTDLFDQGKLKFAVFSKDVAVILQQAGLTPAAAKAVGGVAFADTVTAQTAGLAKQAGLITSGPQRPSTGLEPNIVNPIDTLRSTTQQIASIAKTQRDTANKLAKDNGKYLKTIANANKAKAFTSALDKNPGVANKVSKYLVGVSG